MTNQNGKFRVLLGHLNPDRANCADLVVTREQIGKRAA